MFRDPLYRQIRRGLRELKDGNTFELCANDLLRPIYPSLAPREGGDDAGLDGLIANEDKRSIQLICTTGEDVLGNLTASIEANIKKGGKSHACIVATSQRLTNSKKRTLENRAVDLKRPLIQIYDQAAIAQLLYRDARWLKELLGFAGDPPALSLFPLTSRPFADVPPVGRDDDLAKLINTAEDIVIVGQPGSGKTHLLFTAAKKAKGRFVVDENITQIADSIRSIRPNFVIVDDAHSRLEFLKRLRLMRKQVDAEFRIVASCWPGQEDAVCASLQTLGKNCHLLEGLPPKQIKEVIQSQKISGPPHLIAELIHQSYGKPGLTVTLCRLCWEAGTARDIVLGTALARDVKLSFEPLHGHAASHLLGCFSVGGEAGMTLEVVARLLNKNVLEVKRTVEQLSAAGVLEISPENRISVHPIRLRQALVRDVFLKPPLMDLTPYLSEVPDFAATTRVLIEAKLLGGELPDEILRQRLEKLSGTYENVAFEEYAHLGIHESEWILDCHPEKLKAVASATLSTTPIKTLNMLLDFATTTHTERSSQGWSLRSEDIMPEIKNWVLSANSDHAFLRREILATVMEKWFAKNRDIVVGVCASGLIMSIKYEETSTPPGESMTLTFHQGVVAQGQISKIASLWPKVLPILREAKPSQGHEIAHFFHEWIHPGFHARNPVDAYETETRGHASKMMTDLLRAFSTSWTMHYHLDHYATKLGLQDVIHTDPIADVLFPARESVSWEEAEKRQREAADNLAEAWKNRDADEIAGILTTIEEQARNAHISSSIWDRHVCWRIADSIDNLERWISSFYTHNAPAQLLEPFLERLVKTSPVRAERWILSALERADLRGLAVCMVVKHFEPESLVWSSASRHFKDEANLIGHCVLCGNVNAKNAKTLLRFSEPSVVSAVATNLWRHEGVPRIPNELLEDWKTAIVNHVDEDHVLERAFGEYPDIGFRWIRTGLEGIIRGTRPYWSAGKHDRALPTAIQNLTREQKRELIDRLPREYGVAELVRSLVGRDLELFAHLLSRKELERVRLDPLRLDGDSGPQGENVVHTFDEGWQKMAIAAMDAGFSEEDVCNASQAGGYSWSGTYSSLFAARLVPFEKLLQHTEPRLAKIGRIGVEYFSRLRDENLTREKRATIKGELP